jgi:hypothetical protein
MRTNKLLLYIIIAFIDCFIIQVPAMEPILVDAGYPGSDLYYIGDYLDPGFVGEPMSMPLPPELIQKARKAGIIKDNSPLDYYMDSRQNFRLDDAASDTPAIGTSAPKYEAIPSDESEVDVTAGDISDEGAHVGKDFNATGAWSLELEDTNFVIRQLDLALIQNRDAIMGHGIMIDDNNTKRVKASGSLERGRMKLAVMPIDSLDIYRLNLSMDTQTTGSYNAYSPEGETWSGTVEGAGIITATLNTLVSLT